MDSLRRGHSEASHVSGGRTFVDPAASQRRSSGRTNTGPDLHEQADLVQLHEATAARLASRGDWRLAYQHLRSALDLLYISHSGSAEQAPIPEQLRHEVDRLRREHAEAQEQSIRDSLTASYNRRYLDQRLNNLLSEDGGESGSASAASGVAVALIDLDWFKQVNDTFGHLVGDRVLQRVVELLCDGLPDEAFCARYGGEEFVLVLPGIDAQTAIAVSESARARVERYPWSAIVPGLHVTISVGVVHEPMHEPACDHSAADAELQLLRADDLLYTAKQSGRNAVAYSIGNRVELAGGASGRRMIAQSRTLETFQSPIRSNGA